MTFFAFSPEVILSLLLCLAFLGALLYGWRKHNQRFFWGACFFAAVSIVCRFERAATGLSGWDLAFWLSLSASVLLIGIFCVRFVEFVRDNR